MIGLEILWNYTVFDSESQCQLPLKEWAFCAIWTAVGLAPK